MITKTESPLAIDARAVADRIAETLRTQVGGTLRRRGLVVAISGGIDSAVCAGLAVRALGPRHVLGLFLPERDSSPESLILATEWAGLLGIEHVTEDITAALDAVGCYRRRDDAIRAVVPEFGDGWKSKIALAGDRLASDRLNVFQVVVQSPAGETRTLRLPPTEYRQIVAATNFKQRVRKMLEYYHADRLHYAVVGTPNRLEYDQGFFVKGGDGLADVKPIAHLYKTQVYALAEYLGVPASIRGRVPTTDTYSLAQTQEEFYFELPALTMDLMLFAFNAGLTNEAAADLLGFAPEEVGRAYREISQKRVTTAPLHVTSLLVEDIGLAAARGAG